MHVDLLLLENSTIRSEYGFLGVYKSCFIVVFVFLLYGRVSAHSAVNC